MRTGFLAGCCAATLLMGAGVAQTQSAADYPASTVKFLVPFAAGGPTDMVARILADQPSARWGGKPVVAFNAVVAPAGVPPAILEKVSADVRAIVTSSTFAERTRALGINAWSTTPQELDAWFAKEISKWAGIAKAANLKAE